MAMTPKRLLPPKGDQRSDRIAMFMPLFFYLSALLILPQLLALYYHCTNLLVFAIFIRTGDNPCRRSRRLPPAGNESE